MDDVTQRVRAHIVESGVSGKLQRARAIEEQICLIEVELRERKERLSAQQQGGVERKLNEKTILAKIAERKKLLLEFDYAMNVMLAGVVKVDREGLTQEQIDRARSYPTEDLIETNRGMARCISGSHVDKNPSMDIRNNFAYCYACGFHADSIGIYMKLHGVGFREAVEVLQ